MLTCAGERIAGILHRPASPRTTGVLVIVGGPQVRVGSHRQFVQLARALALRGYAVLRFDVRGMGDSEGDPRTFTDIGADIQTALDAFARAMPTLRRFVLWGLCDGASAALLHQADHGDPRVQGLALLNPWVRSDQTLARAHVKHYYARRLREPDFWHKLWRGGVPWSAMRGLVGNIATAFGRTTAKPEPSDFRDAMARAWRTFPGAVLLALSGRDLTAREFLEALQTQSAWAGALDRPNVTRLDFATADHTFSARSERELLETAVADWLDARFPKEAQLP